MNKPESPCHFCEHRAIGCHSECVEYKAYCNDIAKIHELKYAASEKDAQMKAYEHCKKQKRRKGKR